MTKYDNWKTNGSTHTCPACGGSYSDSDGGCDCGEEMTEAEMDAAEESRNEAKAERQLAVMADRNEPYDGRY